MSHDQRPGRMRVVKDPSDSRQRRGDATTIEGRAETVAISDAGGAASAGASAGTAGSAAGKLPLLPAGLFLLACAAGGVLVAVIRPLGLG